jgi:hypothetical protein
VFYRLPESKQSLFVDIPSGQQRDIGTRDWSSSQRDFVIRQLERFGARERSQINTKLKDFGGLVYSFDKELTEEKIQVSHEVVLDNAEKRSAKEAINSAIAFDAATRDKKTNKRLAKVSEVEVIEDVNPKERPSGKEVKMKIAVAEDGQDNPKELVKN